MEQYEYEKQEQRESSYVDFQFERIDVEEENKKEKRNNIKGTIIATIIVFLVALIVSVFRMEYQRTTNMWWLIIYGLCIHLVEKCIIVLFAAYIIGFIFKVEKRIGIFLTFIVVVFMLLHSPQFMRDYSLNGEGQNYGNMLAHQLMDVVFDDYTIIKPTDIQVIEKKFRGGKRSSKTTYYYYLDINNGEYVVPIMAGDEKLIDAIYNFEYVELKVHKYTKILYEINGIKVNKLTREDVDNINALYDDVGCQLCINVKSVCVLVGDDVNCEFLQVAIFNPAGELVMEMPCNTSQKYPLYQFEDGTWTVVVTDRKKIYSNNMILYDVVNGTITNVRSEEYR